MGIKEVLDSLGDDIQEIQMEIAKGQRRPMFRLQHFKVKLTLAIDLKGKAGINIWVVNTGTDVSRLRTHEVEITMIAPKGKEYSSNI